MKNHGENQHKIKIFESLTPIIIFTLINLSKQQIKNCQDYYEPISRGCKTCKPGYYRDLNIYFLCYKCSDNCQKCLDRSTCLECKDTFFLNKIENSEETIKKFSLPSYNKTCESCPQDCMRCSSSSKCDECIGNLIISDDGKCYQRNPILSFIFTLIICVYLFISCLKNSYAEIDKMAIEKRRKVIKDEEKRLNQRRNRLLSMMTIDSALAVRNTILKRKEQEGKSGIEKRKGNGNLVLNSDFFGTKGRNEGKTSLKNSINKTPLSPLKKKRKTNIEKKKNKSIFGIFS